MSLSSICQQRRPQDEFLRLFSISTINTLEDNFVTEGRRIGTFYRPLCGHSVSTRHSLTRGRGGKCSKMCNPYNANVGFCHSKSIFITIHVVWLSGRARCDTWAVSGELDNNRELRKCVDCEARVIPGQWNQNQN